jgi:hypothetical protein
MAKRMVMIFEDEALYRALQVEVQKKGLNARDAVMEAVREWLDAREDEELGPEIDAALKEWGEKGGVKLEDYLSKKRGGTS